MSSGEKLEAIFLRIPPATPTPVGPESMGPPYRVVTREMSSAAPAEHCADHRGVHRMPREAGRLTCLRLSHSLKEPLRMLILQYPPRASLRIEPVDTNTPVAYHAPPLRSYSYPGFSR